MARPVGRPRIPIDQEKLEQCAERQWTHAEIAAHFKVSVDTIQRNYAELIEECRGRGKAKLRDLQWRSALEKGSDRMLIHLGEHYLNQKKKMEVTGRDGEPLPAAVIPQVIITLPDNGFMASEDEKKPSEPIP